MEKSVIHLLRCKTNEAVEAELWDDISDEHIKLWQDHWLPPIQSKKESLEKNKIPKEKWPQDLHWQWDKKTDWSRKLLSLRRFSIVCEGRLQGLMLVNLTKMTCRAIDHAGKDLAYIEFVSTAPWNRLDISNEQVFSLVGRVMIRVAVDLSREEGFRGRIGLHSLPQANLYYSGRCGMTDLGADDSYHGLVYFEMTEKQAAEFLGKK